MTTRPPAASQETNPHLCFLRGNSFSITEPSIWLEFDGTLPDEVACTTDAVALWPPIHQMEDVEVFVQATDNWTDPANLILLSVTVSSNEPDDSVNEIEA